MGFFKKKEMDLARSDENKAKMRALFNQVMENGDEYKLVYGISQKIKTANYVLARKTTYLYTSLIIGFRESDMSFAILQTTPELEGCSDPEIFKMSELKKAKIVQGQFTLYYQGGIMAGYTQFCIMDSFEADYCVYISQAEEAMLWDDFWAKFLKS